MDVRTAMETQKALTVHSAEVCYIPCVLMSNQPTQNHNQGRFLTPESRFKSGCPRIAFAGWNPIDRNAAQCGP
jgi:hypothetical protein